MRKINSANQIWYEESDAGYRIGFTKSFLAGMDQCWHILPAHNERFKLKSPLLTIETNEALFSILSPVVGFLDRVDDKAQNFPDQLTEDDAVMMLTKVAPVDPLAQMRAQINAQQEAMRAQLGAQVVQGRRPILDDPAPRVVNPLRRDQPIPRVRADNQVRGWAVPQQDIRADLWQEENEE